MSAAHEDFLCQMARLSTERAEGARQRRAALEAEALEAPAVVPLSLDDRFDLIAEIKRASPSVGNLADVEADAQALQQMLHSQATAYVDGGAAALSVLTEPSRFLGHLDHLRMVVAAVGGRRPVMRKDFLVHPVQLLETRAAGASGALLITRMLTDEALSEMLTVARDLGLFVLLEAFDAEDLRRMVGLGVSPAADHPGVLLGLNCRDLKSLQVDFERLFHDLPWPEGLRVAESGLSSPGHAARCARQGYRLALVGSALMTSGTPRDAARALIDTGRREVPGG
ncbi:MAG: indole-3-glycerol-phosphate synthase [Bradymonadia bacterium]